MRDGSRGRPKVRWAVTLLALIAMLIGGAFWQRRVGTDTPRSASTAGALPRGVSPSDLNLLIITLDTTRADRLGAYGWPQSVTPNSRSAWRPKACVFEHAVSPAPLTLPVAPSLFTAKYPPSTASATMAASFSTSARRRWPNG